MENISLKRTLDSLKSKQEEKLKIINNQSRLMKELHVRHSLTSITLIVTYCPNIC